MGRLNALAGCYYNERLILVGSLKSAIHEPWRCRLKTHRHTFSEAHHPRTLSSLRRLQVRTSEIRGFPVVDGMETKDGIRTVEELKRSEDRSPVVW